MDIIFIVDFWDVSSGDYISVEHPDQVVKFRKQIKALLSDNEEGVTRYKFTKPVIYERFNDLEGLVGIAVNRIVPQVQLGKILNERVPDWLDNTGIVKLGLLNLTGLGRDVGNNSDILTKIISMVLPTLLDVDSLTMFYDLVHEKSEIILNILQIEQLYLFVLAKLRRIASNDSVERLLKELKRGVSPADTLLEIAREQFCEKARQFVHLYEIPNISFPPRKFDSYLLNDLPTIHIKEEEAEEVLRKFLKLLENVEVYVANDQFDPRHFSEIIIPWPSYIKKISNLIDENPNLATTALKESLKEFDEPFVVELREKVVEYLNLGACDPLQKDSDIPQALVWCREYLIYAKHRFLQNQEPDCDVSNSFTQWFLSKRLEIKRSDYDWSIISETVADSLNKNKLVVFCVVDALGAIHLDLLRNELESNLEGVEIKDKLLFAPIPTLTEVGKMAVVTGKNHQTLPKGSQESIVRSRYENFLHTSDSLHLMQSWKDFRNAIGNETHFIVCFENRIDERLHGCIDFEKHQKDVQQIITSLVKDIKNWLVRAAQLQKEIEIIISADHGASCISKKTEVPANILSCGERVCRVDSEPMSASDIIEFIEDPEGGGKGYITPKNRTRFSGETRLVHGGLTAEEVLIPFILIKKGELLHSRQPVELFVEKEHGQIVEGGWQINLSLVAQSTKVEKVHVLAGEPFAGREGPIGPLYQHRKKLFRFMLKSNIEQYGLLKVPFIVDYQLEGGSENQRCEMLLDIRLPLTLIEKDEATQSFDDMFD